VLIRAYGLFWRADEIAWNPERGGPHGEVPRFALLGRQGSRTADLRVADFFNEGGIYVLYGDYGPRYVGLTLDRGLGWRLREHRHDRHRDHWDRFSWFGFRNVLKSRNTLGLSELSDMALTKQVVQRQMIREMEALLIHAMGLHNIHRDRFPAGEKWTQVRLDERQNYIGRLTRGRRAPESRSVSRRSG
jgi:hypothetical protein